MAITTERLIIFVSKMFPFNPNPSPEGRENNSFILTSIFTPLRSFLLALTGRLHDGDQERLRSQMEREGSSLGGTKRSLCSHFQCEGIEKTILPFATSLLPDGRLHRRVKGRFASESSVKQGRQRFAPRFAREEWGSVLRKDVTDYCPARSLHTFSEGWTPQSVKLT